MLAVVAFRAFHQAVTIDEADAYLAFTRAEPPLWFYPSSGNHLANTLLGRLSTSLFGLSPFTLRLPAIAGAVLFCAGNAFLLRRLTRSAALAAVCFLVIGMNPFFLDYLVAARGYSLALGFLACSAAVAVRFLTQDNFSMVKAAGATFWVALGCGFAAVANFSCGFTAAAFVVLFALYATKMSRAERSRTLLFVLAAAGAGALPPVLLAGWTLWRYPAGELHFGARDLAESWRSMAEALFPNTNAEFPQPGIESLLRQSSTLLGPAFLVLLAMVLLLALLPGPRPWHAVTRLFAATVALSALFHAAAHAVRGMLLPADRTGLFLVYFALLTMVAVGLTLRGNLPLRFARILVSITFVWMLAHSALSFRYSFFRLWIFNADVDQGFRTVTAGYPPAATQAACEWRYVAVFNFYRVMDRTGIPECAQLASANADVYFLYAPDAAPLMQARQLRTIYASEKSGLLIAVRPGL